MPRTRKHYRAPVDEKTIGKKLRALRERRGMSQSEVAEELAINQPLISAYEQGTVRIHSALLAGFAKTLKTTPDEILGFAELPANGSIVKDRRFLRRLEKIDRLPKRERQLLLGTIDAVLKSAGIS